MFFNIERDGMDSIYESFSIMYRLAKVLGVACVKAVKIDDTYHIFTACNISVIHGSIVYIIKVFYLFFNFFMHSNIGKHDVIAKLVYYLQVIVGALYILSILFTRIYYKILYESIFNNLININIQLQKLGLRINSKSSIIYTIKLIIIEFGFFTFIALVIIFYMYDKDHYHYSYIFNFGMCIFFRMIYLVQFRIIIRIIENIFICIEQYLYNVMEEGNPYSLLKAIKVLSALHCKLFKVARYLNNIFSLPLFIYYIHSFIIFLTHTYNICYILIVYSAVSNDTCEQLSRKFLFSIVWLLYYGTNTWYFAVNSEILGEAVSD